MKSSGSSSQARSAVDCGRLRPLCAASLLASKTPARRLGPRRLRKITEINGAPRPAMTALWGLPRYARPSGSLRLATCASLRFSALPCVGRELQRNSSMTLPDITLAQTAQAEIPQGTKGARRRGDLDLLMPHRLLAARALHLQARQRDRFAPPHSRPKPRAALAKLGQPWAGDFMSPSRFAWGLRVQSMP